MTERKIKMKDIGKRKGSQVATSTKSKNVGSLFNSWEMEEYPKSLTEGIRRAQRREYVRTELHKLQKFKGGKVV
jgi:c-di-GMP-binding flagellar brake protein YcgR